MTSKSPITATQPVTVLQRLTLIRQEISAIAETPEVITLVTSQLYHPDLTVGDAISSLDELGKALQDFGTVQQRQMVSANKWHIQTAIYDAACDGTAEARQTIHARNIPAMQEALYQLGLTSWRYERNGELSEIQNAYYDFHIILPNHLQSPEAIAALWFTYEPV